MAGTLLWLGKGIIPPATYASSTLQQRITKRMASHLMEANSLIRSTKKWEPKSSFKRSLNFTALYGITFSYASFNFSPSNSYGRTRIFSGLPVLRSNPPDIYHILDWSSTKQKRICHSSYGSEIRACPEVDDRMFYMRTPIRSISAAVLIRDELIADSVGLYDTISTVHDGNKYRLR